MRLTKKVIDAAKYKGGMDIRWDDQIAGFGVRVWPSGKKSFVVRYRNADGRKRYLTIGRYGVLTLPQARNEARKHLVAATLGGYLGAPIARALPREAVRWLIALIGFGMSAIFFARLLG